MKFYDISVPIKNGMLVWPGDPGVDIKTMTTVEKDGIGDSDFSFGSHTGTHVDAPNHFVADTTGVDKIALEKLIGECIVADLTKLVHLEINPQDLAKFPLKKGSRILFKTGNFRYLKGNKFPDSYVSLSKKGAEYLVSKGVVLVGTDFLGIEKRKNPGHPVHVTLLKAGVVNVEGLDLSEVPAGKYELICLPLRVVDSDGSPARVVLIRE